MLRGLAESPLYPRKQTSRSPPWTLIFGCAAIPGFRYTGCARPPQPKNRRNPAAQTLHLQHQNHHSHYKSVTPIPAPSSRLAHKKSPAGGVAEPVKQGVFIDPGHKTYGEHGGFLQQQTSPPSQQYSTNSSHPMPDYAEFPSSKPLYFPTQNSFHPNTAIPSIRPTKTHVTRRPKNSSIRPTQAFTHNPKSAVHPTYPRSKIRKSVTYPGGFSFQ